jgi:hypothetical protein
MLRQAGSDVVDGSIDHHPAIIRYGVAGNFIRADAPAATGHAPEYVRYLPTS